jgi:hypothetical protein
MDGAPAGWWKKTGNGKCAVVAGKDPDREAEFCAPPLANSASGFGRNDVFMGCEEESKSGRLRQLRHTVGREKTMIGDAAQYRELVTLYGSYGDNELVELGRGMTDLTEMAQEALKGELTRRGLKIAPAGKPVEARVLSEGDLADMRSYAESAPAECIFDFEDERAVTAAYYALTAEGIEAIVVSGVSGVSGGARPDKRGPRVVVTPKDAGRAAAILSQPSAEELKEEAFAGFDLPKCPACGGAETLLESVDPVNQWRCDGCGHTWLEESVPSMG